MTAACTETSSAETGSSATTTCGAPAKARAMPMRCFCPPESWRGIRRAKARGSLTRSSSSSIRASRSAFDLPTRNFSSTRMIWPPMLWLGFSVSKGFWNTIWIEETVRVSRRSMPRLADLLVAEADRALGRGLEPEQHLGERRLAAARSRRRWPASRPRAPRSSPPRWPSPPACRRRRARSSRPRSTSSGCRPRAPRRRSAPAPAPVLRRRRRRPVDLLPADAAAWRGSASPAPSGFPARRSGP